MMRVTLSCFLLAVAGHVHAASMPEPFTRELLISDPCQTGSDVDIYQNLISRGPGGPIPLSGCYDQKTATATKAFQQASGLSDDGIVGPDTASKLLGSQLVDDGYVDNGKTAHEQGYMYKVTVPVHRNRSIETTATLAAGNGTVLRTFTVRTHGHNKVGSNTWPSYSNTVGLNSFSSDGNTPTGLMTFDLNSPEPAVDNKFYGPYPVNRAVKGIDGNAGFLVPNVRNGLLLHTGEWPIDPSIVMPNSDGCIHSAPENIEAIWHDLVALGVDVHQNTGGQKPYPYTAQGLLSVYLVD